MNELSSIFIDIHDGESVVLENRTYHVRQDDSFIEKGYFCSNTAKLHENPDGTRYSAVFLKDRKNITIDGNGAEIMIHGKMTPLLFDRCENVTVKNLTIDYACPTMTEFTVLSNDNGNVVIRINDECLFRKDGNDLVWTGETGADGKPYWEYYHTAQGRYVKVYNPDTEMCHDFNRNDLAFESLTQLDEHTLSGTLKNREANLPTGSIVQTRSIVRDQVGSLFNRCKNLEFLNLRVKFMHGLGMVSQFCENVRFTGCDFTPAKGRTIASTADFFQFSGCKGKLIIDKCKARGAQDDYVNVHGTHLRIVDKNEEEKSIIVRFMHPETWGFQAFEKGDSLEFIKWDTLIPYAETVVTDYEKLNDTDIKLWLDRDLPEITIDKDVVENASWTPSLHVTGCNFGPTSGRGILCTTRKDVIIENNRFRKLWGPALLIEDDCNFWYESGYTENIIFRNNIVDSCSYASVYEAAPVIRVTPKVMDEESREFVHRKLTIENNTFLNPITGRHAIWLEYIEEVNFIDNTFDAPYDIYKKVVGKATEQ